MQTESTAINRIKEAREAIASARSAMEKADAGLSGIENFAEKAETARRHPVATTAILLAVGLAATLTFMGLRNDDEA